MMSRMFDDDDDDDGDGGVRPLIKPREAVEEDRTLIDVKYELMMTGGDGNDGTTVKDESPSSTTTPSALKVVEDALARQVTTKKLSLRQLTVTNQGLGLLEKATDELKRARAAAKEGEEALERVMRTLRRAATRPGSEEEGADNVGEARFEKWATKAEAAEEMIHLVEALAVERDRAIEAASLCREKSTAEGATELKTVGGERRRTFLKDITGHGEPHHPPKSSITRPFFVPTTAEKTGVAKTPGVATGAVAVAVVSTPPPTLATMATTRTTTKKKKKNNINNNNDDDDARVTVAPANNDADWAQTASAPPPAIPVTAAKLRELAAVAERAEMVGSTPMNLAHVLDSLVVTPLSTHPPAPGGGVSGTLRGNSDDDDRSRSPDGVSDVLMRVASIVRVMATTNSNPPDAANGGSSRGVEGREGGGGGDRGTTGGDGEADELVSQVLELVAQLDAARRSAEDVAAAARADAATMRQEVAAAWEALGTPTGREGGSGGRTTAAVVTGYTPTQSSVERFAEELEALLQEKDAVTAAVAHEADCKRRAIVASAEAQRQLVLQTGARARAESALRSAHEQVEGLKRHARELADLNQSSRQQAAMERRLAQRLKQEVKHAVEREEKEKRRADALHANLHELRAGLTTRTREAARHAEEAKKAREEKERERGETRLLREREKALESKVCELAEAVARQAQTASASASREKEKERDNAHGVSGMVVRELEVMVQELAREEIRSRRRAAEAESASEAAEQATAEALSRIAGLKAEVSTLETQLAEARRRNAIVVIGGEEQTPA